MNPLRSAAVEAELGYISGGNKDSSKGRRMDGVGDTTVNSSDDGVEKITADEGDTSGK